MADFRESLSATQPASDLAPALAALWWGAKGNWDMAHRLVQDEDTADAAWVHAYLAWRAILAMPVTGTGEQASRWQRIHSKPSGSGSSPRYWRSENHGAAAAPLRAFLRTSAYQSFPFGSK
jgi:hypothetical protein